MTIRQITAELWYEASAVLGEGPNWDEASQRFSWVDVVSSTVYVNTASGSALGTHRAPGHVGAALPAHGGGWLVALPSSLALLSEEGQVGTLLALEQDMPGNRANDAKCDPLGRAFVGTMSYDESVTNGALYRIDPGPQATRVLSGLGVANGLGWSPDATTMYFIDSPTREVRAYPFDRDSGAIGEGRPLARVSGGYPDGMCTDDDGCLWVALFAGGCVHRYTPNGDLDTVVHVPATYTTSCCFGGPGRDLLVVTTATRDLDEAGRAAEPLAGSVFAVSPGVSGPGATPWRRLN
ncbi:MAG TPA: SMP-30/gluconolactonase/LRE family protein [Acidimicrobiales bacterium]|nr:SMP-30/gluconolactonase/LRE family protein [Acidimicrobiales bacterium]